MSNEDSDSQRRYDTALALLFTANFREAARAAHHLQVSLRRTQGLFPLTGARLEALDEDGLERLDAFRVRYTDLQDLLAGKLFRGLLKLEEEAPMTQLDVLNAMEKRRIIDSFEDWKELREIRNAFMHDYPEGADERAEALSLAVAAAPRLLDVLRRLRSFVLTRVGLPPEDLPEAP
jgi:hypothetical protein